MTNSRTISALGAALTFCFPSAIGAESRFEGRYEIGFEAERKKCTSCTPSEYDNDIEVTVLDLVLKPKSRPHLSFGLEIEYDTESEGAFLGNRRKDIVNNYEFGGWVRRDFDTGFWARVQATAETDEGLLDLGGRVGFSREISETTEFSGYLNLERRFKLRQSSTADRGTYLELGTEVEWDWGDYGAWLELEASQWFFDSGAAPDETELTLQPGVWLELGETDHRGLLWFEMEYSELTGSRRKKEYTAEIGIGLEFDLPKQAKLMTGITIGKEREKRPGRPDEHSRTYGLEVAFQKRF